MRLSRMRIWLLIGLVIWCGCKNISDPVMDEDPPVPVAMPAGAEIGALAKANNQFAFELWRKAAATSGNSAISPVSITTALAMAWRGAKGETAAQMRAVLHFDANADVIAPRWGQLSRALQDPGRPMTLRIANRLFGEAGYPFEHAFVDATRSAFGAAGGAIRGQWSGRSRSWAHLRGGGKRAAFHPDAAPPMPAAR